MINLKCLELEHPIAGVPSRKLADIGDVAAAVLPSFITGLFSSKNTQDVNEANKELAEKQMSFNSVEAATNRAWVRNMWNLQNQYNSPANQRRLLEQAGFNPALAYSSPATAGAVSSVGNASSGSSPNMIPTDYSWINQIGQNLMQAKLIDAQAKNYEADTLTKVRSLDKQLSYLDKQIKLADATINDTNASASDRRSATQLKQQAFDLQQQLKEYQILNADYGNQYLKKQMDAIDSEIGYREFQKGFSMLGLAEQKRFNSEQIQSMRDASAVAYGQLHQLELNSQSDRSLKSWQKFKTIAETYGQQLHNAGVDFDQRNYQQRVNTLRRTWYGQAADDVFKTLNDWVFGGLKKAISK